MSVDIVFAVKLELVVLTFQRYCFLVDSAIWSSFFRRAIIIMLIKRNRSCFIGLYDQY